MATLAEINDTLVAQNVILGETNESVKSSSSNIDKLVKQMAGDRMDALETEAEGRRAVKQQTDISSAKMASDTKGGFSLPSLPSLGIGKLFGAGSLLGLGATLGKTLLTRGIPALLLNTFADEIANYVESATGKKELGDAAFRAVQGVSIGMIFGKRFALIGGVINTILTKENREELAKLGDNLKTTLSEYGIDLPSFSEMVKGVTSTVGAALKSINSLFGGGGGNFDFGAVAATLGGLALLLAPGSTFKLLLAGLGGLGSGIKGLLGLGFGGKGAAGGLLKGAAGLALTPAGLAAMIAGSLYFAIKSDQDEDAELKKLQERIDAFKQKNPNASNVVPALSDKEWKRYQQLSAQRDTAKGGGIASDVETGGDDPLGVQQLDVEKRNQTKPLEPKRVPSVAGGRVYTDPNLIDPTAYDEYTPRTPTGTATGYVKTPMERRRPQTADNMQALSAERTAMRTQPIIVNTTNAPVNSVSSSSAQSFISSTGSVFDAHDPFLMHGFSR